MKRLPLFLFLALALCTACADNDAPPADGDEIPAEIQAELRAARNEELAQLARTLFVYENPETRETTLVCGTRLHDDEPTVTYIGVTDLAAAEAYFKAHMLPDEEALEVRPDGSMGYDLGAEGSVWFTPGGGSGSIAAVSVCLTAVPELSRVVFIPESLWPDNDVSTFRIGAIYKHTSPALYYLCVAVPNSSGCGWLLRAVPMNDKGLPQAYNSELFCDRRAAAAFHYNFCINKAGWKAIIDKYNGDATIKNTAGYGFANWQETSVLVSTVSRTRKWSCSWWYYHDYGADIAYPFHNEGKPHDLDVKHLAWSVNDDKNGDSRSQIISSFNQYWESKPIEAGEVFGANWTLYKMP